MVAVQVETSLVDEPVLLKTPFGEISYNQLTRVGKGRKPLIQVDRIHSRSTDYAKIQVKSPTIFQFTPREDTINIVLRPSESTGLGPFSPTKENLIGVSATTSQSSFWSAELPGTELHSLTVRRSLLAKHAFDIVDTSILENFEALTLDEARSKLLMRKLEQLLINVDSTQSLDIRLTHLLLSICEIAHHRIDCGEKRDTKHLIWQCLRDEMPQSLDTETLMDKAELSEHQLNHLFRRQTGLSTKQFISNYKLNCIRQELVSSGRKYAECVEDYGYQSPDQLYRAYQKLFSEEPPLNTH